MYVNKYDGLVPASQRSVHLVGTFAAFISSTGSDFQGERRLFTPIDYSLSPADLAPDHGGIFPRHVQSACCLLSTLRTEVSGK